MWIVTSYGERYNVLCGALQRLLRSDTMVRESWTRRGSNGTPLNVQTVKNKEQGTEVGLKCYVLKGINILKSVNCSISEPHGDHRLSERNGRSLRLLSSLPPRRLGRFKKVLAALHGFLLRSSSSPHPPPIHVRAIKPNLFPVQFFSNNVFVGR